jgi:S1-C subfamily serine protease
MEDLTQQQMVLLTLLVSFVASIATSVSVVSLLNESPTTITQTVNRIVERTIEKVVPDSILPPAVSSKPTLDENKETVLSVVEMNLSKMILFRNGETSLGIGFAASGDMLAITDKNILGEGTDYTAVLPDGKTYSAVKVYEDKHSNIAVLELLEEKDQKAINVPFVTFSPNEPKLGSSVIALGGKGGATVYTGIVSEKTKNNFLTNISFRQIDRGGILFGMDGKILGMNAGDADEEKYVIPSATILSVLEDYRKEAATKIP